MSVQVDDAEILRKFQDEKTRNEAFNLLLKKYQQKLYWHIRRMVVDHDDDAIWLGGITSIAARAGLFQELTQA